jgi:hypothetical protein
MCRHHAMFRCEGAPSTMATAGVSSPVPHAGRRRQASLTDLRVVHGSSNVLYSLDNRLPNEVPFTP